LFVNVKRQKLISTRHPQAIKVINEQLPLIGYIWVSFDPKTSHTFMAPFFIANYFIVKFELL